MYEHFENHGQLALLFVGQVVSYKLDLSFFEEMTKVIDGRVVDVDFVI